MRIGNEATWRRQGTMIGLAVLIGLGVVAWTVSGNDIEYRSETSMELPPDANVTLAPRQFREFLTRVSSSGIDPAVVSANLTVRPDDRTRRVRFFYQAPSRYEAVRALRSAKEAYIAVAWSVPLDAYAAFGATLQRLDTVTARLAALPTTTAPADPIVQDLLASQAEAQQLRDGAEERLKEATAIANAAQDEPIMTMATAGERDQDDRVGLLLGPPIAALALAVVVGRFRSWRSQRRNFAW